MDLRSRVSLGKTGVMVSRIGLASGYGVPAASIEKAFHEYRVNHLYVSPLLNLGSMIEAVRCLAPRHRDELVIVLAKAFFHPGLGGFSLESFVDKWLLKLGLEWTDLLLQDVKGPRSPKLMDRLQRLQECGKVRFTGMSSHKRHLFPKVASGEVTAPDDFFHIRYNAVHTGAEQEVFPKLSRDGRPGIVIFTATCWRKLLKQKLMPSGEHPLTAADCYRFVLSNPDVDICLTAPGTAGQMEDNFKALEKGSLDEEEMARVRRIGKYIYGGKKR